MEQAAFSLNNFCNGNTALSSVCIVQLHDTVNNIKIMIVVKDTFYSEFMSPDLGLHIQCQKIFVRI